MFAFGLSFFWYYAAFAVLMPHLPLLLKARGFSLAEVGMLMAAFGMAGVIGPVAIGPLVDRTGRYRLVILLSIVLAAAFLAPLAITAGFWVAMLLVTILGVAFKTIYPTADVLALHALADAAQQYGRVRAFGSLGFVTASLVLQFTGVLAAGLRSIVYVFGVTSAAGFVLTFLLPRPVVSGKGRAAGSPEGLPGLGGVFWLGMLVFFLGNLGMMAYYSFFSIYLQEVLGLERVSGLWALAACSEIPVIFFAGPLIRRFDLHRIFLVALGAMLARLLVYALLPALPAVVLAQLLHGLTFGAFYTAGVEFVRRRTVERRRGLAMAVYNSVFMGVTALVGPLVGGFVLEAAGYRAMFLLYALPVAAAALIVAAAGGVLRQRAAEALS